MVPSCIFIVFFEDHNGTQTSLESGELKDTSVSFITFCLEL